MTLRVPSVIYYLLANKRQLLGRVYVNNLFYIEPTYSGACLISACQLRERVVLADDGPQYVRKHASRE